MKKKKPKIDWAVVKNLGIRGCSGTEIAARLGISPQVLYNACQDEKKCLFSEFNATSYEHGNSQLREAQFDLAMTGDGKMLIHLGKHRLGQKDAELGTIVPAELEGKFLCLMTQIKELQEDRNAVSTSQSIDDRSD
jgi:hypothetical protein